MVVASQAAHRPLDNLLRIKRAAADRAQSAVGCPPQFLPGVLQSFFSSLQYGVRFLKFACPEVKLKHRAGEISDVRGWLRRGQFHERCQSFMAAAVGESVTA